MPIPIIPYSSGTNAPPSVTTNIASDFQQTTAILSGTINNSIGSNITEYGFQYGATPNPDRSAFATGSNLGIGNKTISIADLTPGQQYFYRFYAINSSGVIYGDWVAFTTLVAIYSITIAGLTRTADVLNKTIQIQDVVTDQQNTMTFSMVDIHGLGGPSTDQEIIITLDDGSRLFGGYLIKITQSIVKGGFVQYDCECVDYVRLLDRNLVNKTYNNMTDAAIIEDILTTYCPGFGITATNVIAGVTIDQIDFNYIQPSQAFRKIADVTGRNWYIDYFKDIHYFPLTQNSAPFNITDNQKFSDGKGYMNLSLSEDASQLKNRVYVRGGTELSNPTTYSTKGDGTTRKFVLPDKPHAVSLTVNGVAKSVGIKNIDTSGFDFYLNFEEKYLEQDAAGTVLSTSDVLTLSYTYDIPILVAVENPASILLNGVHEFPIFDSTIATTKAARDRASGELTDYANDLIEAQFDTYTSGFRSGQFVNINSTVLNIINQNYLVKQVQPVSLGGGKYMYKVYLASAKTMGIIRFLIELLEQMNNSVQVGANEVLDNLLTLSDSLNADSLTDLLTIDSAGPYRTWCTDSLQVTPTTRAIWNLFAWK